MTHSRTNRWLVLATLAALVAAPVHAGVAQEERGPAVALAGGVFQYDLSGTGNTPFAAVRVEVPLTSYLLVEPGAAYTNYEAQFGDRISIFIPEVQLQLQTPTRVVRPFLGVGAGGAFAWGGGDSDTQLTLSAGAGVRVRVSEPWWARAELRLRSIDPWHGAAAEWTVGLARRF